MGRLVGKVAFVTGAARGQGRSDAVLLAQEGADIIAVDICSPVPSVDYPMADPGDLAETVRLVEAAGRRIVATEVDVRNLPELEAALGAGIEALGRLDVVVAGAGVVGFDLTWDIEPAAWQEMLDINLTGAWHTAKAAVPHLLAGGNGGSIIFHSSKEGLKGLPTLSHYSAAKHGVIGLMRSMSLELGPEFIRVNSVAATAVNTPMIHNDAAYGLFMPDVVDPTIEDAAKAFGVLNVMPIPWVEPWDVSNAVLFLASDESRYITGVALPVDAGALQK